MNFIKSMSINLLKYFDLVYFLKFAFFLIVLYYFNAFYNSITEPTGNIYSSFLDHYLNYIAWIRRSILHTSNLIAHVFGLNSYVGDIYTLKVFKGASVTIEIPCLGIGMMSFWIAFVTAHTSNWRKKLYWCLGGIIAIWFINCWRVALLLLAIEKGWKVSKWDVGYYMDHHTIYNLAAYSLIVFLIYLYYRQNKKETYEPIVV